MVFDSLAKDSGFKVSVNEIEGYFEHDGIRFVVEADGVEEVGGLTIFQITGEQTYATLANIRFSYGEEVNGLISALYAIMSHLPYNKQSAEEPDAD